MTSSSMSPEDSFNCKLNKIIKQKTKGIIFIEYYEYSCVFTELIKDI